MPTSSAALQASQVGARVGSAALAALAVRRLATDKSGRGHMRVDGALTRFGHRLGRRRIRRILKDHGIEPAPERGKGRSRTAAGSTADRCPVLTQMTVSCSTYGRCSLPSGLRNQVPRG